MSLFKFATPTRFERVLEGEIVDETFLIRADWLSFFQERTNLLLEHLVENKVADDARERLEIRTAYVAFLELQSKDPQ